MTPELSSRRCTPPHATCVVFSSSHSSACHLCCLVVVALLRMPPVLSGRRRTPPHATCVVWSSSHSPKKDATRTNHQVLQFPPFFFDIMFSFLVFFLVRPLLLSLPFEVGTTSYCIARVQTSQTSNQDSCSPLCPTPCFEA